MRGFTKHTGIAVPLDASNVDTDAIIPKQFLQKVTKIGFGQHLFNDWRFIDGDGVTENPDFVLNFPRYKNGSILLAKENFGNGSSREHAPWALMDYGFKAVIASSFADIFYGNSLNNHLLPVKLDEQQIENLFQYVLDNDGALVTVDLEQQLVIFGEQQYHFDLDPFRRHCLLNGLDNIGLTLQHIEAIDEYEKKIPKFLR